MIREIGDPFKLQAAPMPHDTYAARLRDTLLEQAREHAAVKAALECLMAELRAMDGISRPELLAHFERLANEALKSGNPHVPAFEMIAAGLRDRAPRAN
jgi:TPP-dependent trihydroxycyclohexane-1,2-dione (THcHDO) dehydratase